MRERGNDREREGGRECVSECVSDPFEFLFSGQSRSTKQVLPELFPGLNP